MIFSAVLPTRSRFLQSSNNFSTFFFLSCFRDEPGPSGMVPTVVISDAEDMDPTQSDKTCYR